jgi:DNA (cytosine-5)-methyltransferase 1
VRALVLFAGAGGACLGLRDAGIEHALSVEWDDDAASTSRAAGFPCVTGDVRDLSLYDDVGSVDLLWSSFPCQDFSSAGSRKGAKGDRNGWPWTVDVLDHLAARGDGPRWLLAENVTGLTTHVGECPTRDGKPQDDPEACPRCYLERVIMPQLRQRFTWADWRILDAADYGVPQRRRRVIIAAGPHPIAWPEATHSGEALAKAKWVTKDYWRAVGVAELGEPSAQESRWLKQRGQLGLFAAEPRRFSLRPWRTVRQALGLGGTLEASRNTDANPTQERPITTDEPIFAVGGKGNQYLTRAGSEPMRLDRPAPSVTTTEAKGTRGDNMGKLMASGAVRGGVDRASDALWLATGRRRLTVEECATLQDFPAGYPWQGTKTAQYRQVGNAVPPTLARVVAESVSKARLRAAMAGARKALTTGAAGFDLGER